MVLFLVVFKPESVEIFFSASRKMHSHKWNRIVWCNGPHRHKTKLEGITKTPAPMLYTAIFHGCKNDYFQKKNCDIFLNFAQNIDCRYTLEPPH